MFLEELTISVNNNNNNVIYCTSLDFGAKKGKIVGFSRFVPATTLTVRSIPRPPPCKIYMRQKSQKAVKKKKKHREKYGHQKWERYGGTGWQEHCQDHLLDLLRRSQAPCSRSPSHLRLRSCLPRAMVTLSLSHWI